MSRPCGDPKCTNPDKILDGDGVKCYGCLLSYHYECAGVAEGTQRRKGEKARQVWRCAQKCRSLEKKENTLKSAAEEDEEGILALDSIKDPDLKTIFSFLMLKMAQIEKSSTFLSNKYDELLQKNEELERKIKEMMKEKEEEIRSLSDKFHELEQYERKCNVEIFGVDVCPEENVYSLVTKVVNQYDEKFVLGDIDYAHRLPSKNKARPPSIIAVLKSRSQKVSLLNSVKKGKKRILQKEIVPNAANPKQEVYITQNISGYYKNLLWKAKQQLENYKYVWFNNCRVYARKTDGDKNVLNIKNEYDLQQLTKRVNL